MNITVPSVTLGEALTALALNNGEFICLYSLSRAREGQAILPIHPRESFTSCVSFRCPRRPYLRRDGLGCNHPIPPIAAQLQA